MLAGLGLALALLAAPLLNARDAAAQRFDFGAGPPVAGRQQVLPDAIYTAERGYGFEPGFPVRAVPGGITGEQGASAFFFSADVPEGNYRVTVALVGAAGDSVVTIKAELRRLMVGPLPVTAGQRLERSFIVNVRTPRIAPRDGIAAGEVKLKAPRETTQEAWAWDRRLTLEFDGTATIVAAITIEPVTVPTIFLIGDSTVCDQSREPFTSWGQMLTRFFGPGVSVANHAESGETYRDSIGRRRLDKIVSVMRPGDWLLMQFGHNDQKQIAAGTGELVLVGLHEGNGVVHLDFVESDHRIRVAPAPTTRHNLRHNAMGKLALSRRPDLAAKFRDPAFQKELEVIRQEGVAWNREETVRGMIAMAMSGLSNAPTEPIIVVAWPTLRFSESAAAKARKVVRDVIARTAKGNPAG